MTDPRRQLPSVDRLLRSPELSSLLADTPRAVMVEAIRVVLDDARRLDGAVSHDWAAEVQAEVGLRMTPTLRPVLNATGVVLHTNLGRAPLADAAVEAMNSISRGYSTLEFDLHRGSRGSRQTHCRSLLIELTGAEDALVVNNAAGALTLVLNEAAEGRDVVISRGELIEIGGSFRIPDILAKSGAGMKEIGTTNRTHLDDYRAALDSGAAAVLTVHRSNFEQTGFVATPEPTALAELASQYGVPYVHDVGSGLLADLGAWGLRGEPRVPEALAGGATVVVFSGDKLLGGPQAGCLVGASDLIGRCRTNPLARALRADKFTLAGLAATLALYRDPDQALSDIPVLRMLTMSAEDLKALATTLAAACPHSLQPRPVPGHSAVGGGAFPDARLPTTLVELTPGQLGAKELLRKLRVGETPVVARVTDDKVLLDPRTLAAESLELVGTALARAVAR